MASLPPWQRSAAVFVFVASLAVRFWGLNAAGNTWDEYFYYDASRSYLRNIVERDFQADHWRANFEHPPVGKFIYFPGIIWNHLVGANDRNAYHAPRVVSAVLGALSVVLVFLIGWRFFPLRVGLVAALIYGLLPPVLAYHKIINLDVTMIFFWLASLLAFFSYLKTDRSSSLWWATLLASLAIATKFNAIFLVVVFFGTILIKNWPRIRQKQAVSVPLPLLLWPIVTLTVDDFG